MSVSVGAAVQSGGSIAVATPEEPRERTEASGAFLVAGPWKTSAYLRRTLTFRYNALPALLVRK